MESLVGREARKSKDTGKSNEDEKFEKASKLDENGVKLIKDFFKNLQDDVKKGRKAAAAKQ